MTPVQALKLLDQLVSGMPLNRQGHAQVSTAVAVLSMAIAPKVTGQDGTNEA